MLIYLSGLNVYVNFVIAHDLTIFCLLFSFYRIKLNFVWFFNNRFCVFMLANKIEMIETVFDHSREMLVSLESRVHLGHLELMAFLATEAHRYLPKAKRFVRFYILYRLSVQW